jgi:hypothetical protein
MNIMPQMLSIELLLNLEYSFKAKSIFVSVLMQKKNVAAWNALHVVAFSALQVAVNVLFCEFDIFVLYLKQLYIFYTCLKSLPS